MDNVDGKVGKTGKKWIMWTGKREKVENGRKLIMRSRKWEKMDKVEKEDEEVGESG